MKMSTLRSVSPIDGRYASKTSELSAFYSESALIKYRLKIEAEYLIFLSSLDIISLTNKQCEQVRNVFIDYSDDDGAKIKEIEKATNHDVKAVEYFMKQKLGSILPGQILEFIHFALTSQDINNTAFPLMIKEANEKVMLTLLGQIATALKDLGQSTKTVAMLARTHGQAASPTSMGKEILVFVERLEKQILKLKTHSYEAKFGGATGNFNAHIVAYPKLNWPKESDKFINSLGLTRLQRTTQIDHYDHIAEMCHTYTRIGTILIDLSRDIWTYISMDYFTQKVIGSEVGSSAMPHKVNPIDFENAEGNLALANAVFHFMAEKLPISRLQRDLSDSTVLRNIGVPMAHVLIAGKSLLKGLSKLELNREKIELDLLNNWAVVSEAIQTILRRESFPNPYEKLKEFSRGKTKLSKADFEEYIKQLDISDELKKELLAITPMNYVGNAFE